MIAIINNGVNPEPTGVHTYTVQINHKVITTFNHLREEGLARCLERAAEAVKLYDKHDRQEDNHNTSGCSI